MSQVVTDIVDIGVMIGGVIAAPFTGGASLIASGAALTDLIATNVAGNQAQQEKANIGDPSANTPPPQPSVTPTSPVTPSAVAGTTESAIKAEKDQAAALQIEQTQQALGQQILGEKTAEVKAEGGITANAAARGLKMEGSPLMTLIAQQQMGKQTTAYTEGQGAATLAGMGISKQAAFDAASLSEKEGVQYIDNQMANMWLGTFTNLLNVGTGMVNKFWNPSSAAATTSGNETSGGLSTGAMPWYNQ